MGRTPDDYICLEEWVRALTLNEQVLELSQSKYQHEISCYRLVLCSRQPLQLENIVRALEELWRRAPHLRLCIQERNEKLWFKEMSSSKVQYEIMNNADPAEEIEKQMRIPFNSATGPLWRAIIIVNQNYDSCMNEISSVCPYQCNLLLTFHHAITDGYTTSKTCDLYMKLLNEIVSGNPVDHIEQLSKFSDGSETERLIIEHKRKLDQKPRNKQMVMRSVQELSELKPIFSEAFPVNPVERQNVTKVTWRELSADDTSKLMTFFQEEELSLNAGFISIANLALMEMFKKRGYKEMINICTYNMVNLRNFWDPEHRNELGFHSGPLCVVTETPPDSINQFLEYAIDVQTNMYDLETHGRTFDECLFLDVKRGTGCRDMEEFFDHPPEHPQFFYSCSNLGDLADVFSGEGQEVEVGMFTRHNSCHRFNSTFINTIHTFRGRLMMGLDYNANNVTSDVAKEYIDAIEKLIVNIVRQV